MIATGSPEIYVAALLRAAGIKADAILGTELEIVGDRLTGRLAGPNCVRAQKAVRVKAWLAENGPFQESWGYGNPPHDKEMLKLVTNPTLIRRGPRGRRAERDAS